MSIDVIETKVNQLKELEAFIAEIEAEAETIKDEIKNYMANEKKVEELILNNGTIVRWTSVLTTRFDTKKFKEKFGDELYKAYTKEVASRRFQIA